MKTVLIALAAVLATGCANRNTLHVHPATGEITNCTASGWGWIGAPMAMSAHNGCTSNMQRMGFIPMDEVEPGMLLVDSNPPGAQVLSGPSEKELRPIGTTPMKLLHPKRTRAWAAECFQIKMDGYKDSPVTCKPAVWGDRVVSERLSKQ